jgi:hypothetical protein
MTPPKPANHWSNYLPETISEHREVVVELPVHGGQDNAAVVTIASRLRGVLGALRTEGEDGVDPLLSEDPDDLYYLLLHLHRMRMTLQGQEERVIQVAHQAGVSLRTLASALELKSAGAVTYRLEKIAEAATRHRTAAAVDEDIEDTVGGITDDQA